MLKPEFIAVKASPKTIYVDVSNKNDPLEDGSKEHPFDKIQEGINYAMNGDIVYVFNGTYYEHIVVNNTVSLIGEDRGTTIVDGSGTGMVVTITQDNVNITGFTIQESGAGKNAGIYLNNINHCNITKNNVSNNEFGILLDYSSNNIISGNNVTNNWYCIEVDDSSSNSIYGNYVANNGMGIFLYRSSNNVLRDNVMAGGIYNFGVWGDELADFMNDVDASNTIDGKPVYYWINRRDIALPLDAGYVALANCTGITVQNLNLTHNAEGILLAHTTNSTITQNDVANNYHGISLYKSLNNSIFGNDVANNWYGIYLNESSNNKIYHNNFVNNTWEQVYVTSGYTNVWDIGHKGNYWSDHAGIDEYSGPNQDQPGSDGISDIPYVIDEYNQDSYPLMNPWSPVITRARVLSVPYRYQDQTMWCGQSSLAMILGYYGVAIHGWNIAADLHRPKMLGVTLGDLEAYVDKHYPQLETRIGNYEDQTDQIFYDIKSDLTVGYPVILNLYGWPKHYVVVVGFNETGLFLNDPSGGSVLSEWNITDNYDPFHPFHIFAKWDRIRPHIVVRSTYLATGGIGYDGSILVIEGTPSPIAGTVEITTSSGVLPHYRIGHIFVRHDDDPLSAVYVDFDGLFNPGLVWYGINHQVSWDASDVLEFGCQIYNHRTENQTYDVVVRIEGEDGITYCVNTTSITTQPYSLRVHNIIPDIRLNEYLNKSQFYTIKVQLLDSSSKQIDWFSVPSIYYHSSGTLVKLHENQKRLYLHVYDLQGRHVGLNYENNQTEIEVLGAYYFDDWNGTTVIILPINVSSFRVVIDAEFTEQTTETYNLTICATKDSQVLDQTSNQYSIQKGRVQKLDVRISQTGVIDVIPLTEVPWWQQYWYVIVGILVVFASSTSYLYIRRRRRR